ncbi:MAG: hypothetical protein GY731_05145, partial [Gammaproteobacteria bacterium]|nr:hypothetical protein [Gammaproteobacteria bacterium]
RLEGLLKPAGLQASVLGYADPAWDLKSVYEELVPLQDFLIKREAARQCGPSHSLDLDKLREGLGPSISTIYRSDGEFRWRWEIHYARR